MMSTRTRFTTCLFVFILSLLCSLNAQAEIDPSSIVGVWLFDEGSGGIAKDDSGHGYDADLMETPVWVQGIRGQALEFQNGSYLEIRNSAENLGFGGVETFTMAAWINSQGGGTVIGKYNAGIIGAYFLQIDAGGIVGFDRESDPWIIYGNKALPSNDFGHVAVTFDGTALKLYVNGELDVQQDWSPQTTDTVTPVLIGARHASDAPSDFFNGVLDEVAIFNVALTEAQIKELMNGLPTESKAGSPMPEDGTADVPRDTSLSWTGTDTAATHNVYFGATWDDVNAADVDAPLDVLISKGQVETTSTLDRVLSFGETYFWRVDEVNGAPDYTVSKGNIWSFEVEPYSIKLPFEAIAATASTVSNGTTEASNTIDGSGLDQDDRHSNTPEDMWMSVAGDASPWLMYEFDKAQKLDQMLIWNSNHSSESVIGWGAKDVEIEVSMDGLDWTLMPEPHQLVQGPGFIRSEAQVIDMGLAQAKYVRLNILNNWGGILTQYAVAEVQFYTLPMQARTPVPATGSVDVFPDTVGSWRAGREADQHTIYVSTDQTAVADGSAPWASSGTPSADLSSFDLQLDATYYWRVDEVNETMVPSVWQGDIWSFSTPERLIVDDFESYGNFSPDRPFQTWLDGIGYSDDEFFPVAYEGNGTGSGLGHDIWSVSSPHFGGQIMEQVSTIPGSSQSMPFYYNNSGGMASHIDRQWATPKHWGGNGIQTMVLHFFGSAGNTGQLYVKINNTKIPYDGDPANLTKLRWTAWPVDLSPHAQDASSVNALSIGAEGASASGMILVDDILLYTAAPEVLAPVAPGTESLVAYWAMDEGAGTTAADSAGSNVGSIEGAVSWVDGHAGTAIELDGGLTSYVNCGASPVFDITEAVTLSAWVNASAPAESHRPIIGKGDHTYMLRHGSGETFDFFFHSNGGWHQISAPVPDSLYLNAWNHVAGSFDGSQIRLYINGVLGASQDYAGAISLATHDVNIGRNSEVIDRAYRGIIDEVRIYNSALTDAEVLYLSNE